MNASNLFFVFWRKWLWFWVIMGLFIFTPVTLIVIRSQKTYWIFHTFCKYWCRLVLLLNGFWSYTKFKSIISSNSAYIICPNHTSKFDIIFLETQKNYDQMTSIILGSKKHEYISIRGIFIRKEFLST